ncbi:hypothetical protein [Leifsonia sp. LS-T14]
MARFEPERRRPWIITAIVVVAVAVIVVGLIVAVAAGGRIF